MAGPPPEAGRSAPAGPREAGAVASRHARNPRLAELYAARVPFHERLRARHIAAVPATGEEENA
ncbi:hypothetical protein [Streptomyces sp. NPDC006134]|uniref:hypothetical protein n=1 Tax=Streptomyces sp. NPDC006134 TaxID=3154467 RepID=UPI003406FDD0